MSNDLFDKDFTIQYIRELRDEMLSKTDKYMIPDFPITDEKREEWKEYRKKLRDITLQDDFENCTLNQNFIIEGITWPTKPI